MTRPGAEAESGHGNIDRREFIRTSALAAGGMVVGACGHSGAEPTGPAPPSVTDPTARVAAVRGTNLPAMTRDALDALGGIRTVVQPGETVFVKPNMVSLPAAGSYNVFAAGECTKPEILVAVAEACLEAGASEVTIGDGSHQPALDWRLARTLDGATDLAREAQRLGQAWSRPVRVASLEVDSPQWVEVPSGTYLQAISVSSLVTRADRVISVPVAKTHSWAQLTLSLKNFVGVTPLWRYGDLARGIADRGVVLDHGSPGAIAAIYLDIVKAVRPDLTIIDFSIGVEGDGPCLHHGGRTVDLRKRLGSWLLLASTDLVAADATAAWIMSHDPARQTQLAMAYGLGLGEYRMERIEVVGERLADLRVPWSAAGLRNQGQSACGTCARRAASYA